MTEPYLNYKKKEKLQLFLAETTVIDCRIHIFEAEHLKLDYEANGFIYVVLVRCVATLCAESQ